jgi:hypothetical protein
MARADPAGRAHRAAAPNNAPGAAGLAEKTCGVAGWRLGGLLEQARTRSAGASGSGARETPSSPLLVHRLAQYHTDYSIELLDRAVNATIRVRPRWVFGVAEGYFTGSPTRWMFGSAKSESSA